MCQMTREMDLKLAWVNDPLGPPPYLRPPCPCVLSFSVGDTEQSQTDRRGESQNGLKGKSFERERRTEAFK